jgi:transcriptional regulator with XRE-family HTH domain
MFTLPPLRTRLMVSVESLVFSDKDSTVKPSSAILPLIKLFLYISSLKFSVISGKDIVQVLTFMSTVISLNISDKSDNERYILQNVMPKESLSDYVRRVMHESNLVLREVAARSGNKISAGYINDIIRQKTINPSVAKLKALAKGLGKPEEEVISIARGISMSDKDILGARFASMLEDIEKLNQPDKAFVIRGLESLSLQIRERIETYKKAPELYSIKGAEGFDLREFLSFIKKSHPDFATDMILDILGDLSLEKYTDEQIETVREFKDRFSGNTASTALTVTG